MKSVCSRNEKDSFISYPCLMISTCNGSVVLFTEHEIGTCVHAGGDNDLGEYSTAWAMDCFKPFNGTVTLSNA